MNAATSDQQAQQPRSAQRFHSDKTFHLFGSLPREIRDMIWEFAMRHEDPGVQVFTTTNIVTEELNIDLRDEYHIFGWYNLDRLDRREELDFQQTAPAEPFQRAWPTKNLSTYTIDSGMWTACTESKEAMEVRHQKRRHGCPTPASSEGCYTGNLFGRTGFFFNNEDEKQYFTVLTHDLVYFQFSNISLARYGHWLPLLTDYHRKQGCDNVALEYDPKWSCPDEWDFKRGRSNDGIVDLLMDFKAYVQHIWFVDYRIRRSRDPSRARGDIREGRQVFRGNGCRFVEVRRRDEEWELEDGTPMDCSHYENEDPPNKYANPFCFVRDMQIGSWAGEMEDFESLWFYDEDRFLTVNPILGSEGTLHVLAVEFDN